MGRPRKTQTEPKEVPRAPETISKAVETANDALPVEATAAVIADARKNPRHVSPSLRNRNTADKEMVSQFLNEINRQFVKPKVHSDEELAARFEEYYRDCAIYGTVPTIEELFFSTGYTYDRMKDIMDGNSKGFTPNTRNIIKRAKEYQKVFDAKLLLAGKIDFVAYCFRGKNYYEMRDQQDIVVAPRNPLGDKASPQQLEAKYTQGLDDD